MLLLGQRPLTASDLDYRLFVGRCSELRRVCRALELGFNVYVHGPPGIGRSSFFRQIERQRPEARYVRLFGFETLEERLEQIERAVTGSNAVERYRPAPYPDILKAFSTKETRVAVDPLRYLRNAADSGNGRRHVVLVDDLGREECHELFGRLRDELWELPVQWAVAGSAASLDPPADTFFEAVVELPLLDRGSLRELVRRRADNSAPEEASTLNSLAGSVIDSVAPCTPRHALAALRGVCLADDATEAASRLAGLRSARAGLTPTADKLLDALLHHGPTHAGDEKLLAEVGVTRSRVVQLLAQFEAADLVTARREGRRKLFAVHTGHPTPADAANRNRVGAPDEP